MWRPGCPATTPWTFGHEQDLFGHVPPPHGYLEDLYLRDDRARALPTKPGRVGGPGDQERAPVLLGPFLGRVEGPLPEGRQGPAWRNNQVEKGNDPAEIDWQQHAKWLECWREAMAPNQEEETEEPDAGADVQLPPPLEKPPWAQTASATAEETPQADAPTTAATVGGPGTAGCDVAGSPPSPPPAATAPWSKNKMPKEPNSG